MRLFRLQPFEFRLDAGQPPRPERLQHVHEPADVGTDLGHAAAGEFFFLTQADGFAAEARQCFLHDAVAGLDHAAEVTNPSDEGVFERHRRDAGRLARILAALVLLPGADVVVVHVRPAVGRRADHVRPALAPQQARQQVHPALRLLEVHPAGDRLADLELHPVELLGGDDRIMTAFLHRIAPVNPAEIDRVAKDADHFLFGEPVAAALLVRAGAVGRVEDAQVVEPPSHRPGGAEFLERVEDAPDDGSPFGVDLQLAGIVLHRAVAEDVAAVPEAPVGPVPHDREGPLGGHLPLKLGEHHDELHHRLTGRHRRVELLPQGDYVDFVFGEQCPQIHEVLQAAGNPVEFEADNEVDLAGSDVPLEPLELRPVLVLGALAGIDVELQRLDGPAFASFAELDFLFDLVLLGDKAVAFSGLPLR